MNDNQNTVDIYGDNINVYSHFGKQRPTLETQDKVAIFMLKTNRSYKYGKLIVYILAILSIVIIVDGLSIYQGQDIDYDLFNYHYVNGYLFIHGLLIKDSLGTLQSYLDPILNSLYYILIRNISPMLENVAIASIQATAIIGLLFTAMEALSEIKLIPSVTISMMLCTCAIIGPDFFSEIGTAMSDTLLSALIIFSLFLLIRTFRKNSSNMSPLSIVLSGILIGIASGLKFTNMVFCIGVISSYLVILIFHIETSNREKLYSFLLLSVSCFTAFTFTYFPVGLILYRAYGNPIFPYYNSIFRSSYMLPISWHDTRWFPHTLISYLTSPFKFCTKHNRISSSLMEIPFRTLFFAISEALLPFYIIKRILTHKQHGKYTATVDFIVLFFVISFIVWEIFFSYYRYISALEIISPLVVFIMVSSIFELKRLRYYFALVALLFIIAAYSIPDANWGRIPFANSNYFGVSTSELDKYHNSLIIIGYGNPNLPIGYVLSYFPISDRFIGIPGDIPGLTNRWIRRNRIVISTWSNRKIFWVDTWINGAKKRNFKIIKEHSERLDKEYGISIDIKSCQIYEARINKIVVCKVDDTDQ